MAKRKSKGLSLKVTAIIFAAIIGFLILIAILSGVSFAQFINLQVEFPDGDPQVFLPVDLDRDFDLLTEDEFPVNVDGGGITEQDIKDSEKTLNMTESSNDPPIEQICDELNLFCGTAKRLQLETNIVKVDSLGSRFNQSLVREIPFLSLFVEETSLIDFRNGFVEFDVNVITDPDTLVMGSGDFDVLVGDQTVLTEIITVDVNGVTDSDGRVRLNFIMGNLTSSPTYLFDFNQLFDNFPDETVSKVSFVLKDFSIDLNVNDINNALNGYVFQEIFSMDILRDDIKVLIQNEFGLEAPSFPEDSTLIIQSIDGVTSACSGTTNPLTGETSRGCFAPKTSRSDGKSGGPGSCNSTCNVMSRDLAPALEAVFVDDSKNNLIDFGEGVGRIIDTNVFRVENYTVDLSEWTTLVSTGNQIAPRVLPNSFEIIYPKSQLNKVYSCYLKAEVTYSRVTGSISGFAWDFFIPRVTDVRYLVCNFPT